MLLEDVLRKSEGEAARVVLIHGGFPWHEQVAYLAAVGLGVWVEFSLSNLVSPASTADRLPRLLDLAPTGRLRVGGDGHGVPETHWFALGVVRDGWSVMRDRLGAASRAGRLGGVERNVFADNARRLYRL